MIKQGVETYGELERYRKAHMVREKKVCIQTTVAGIQTESTLNAFIILGKYVISNLMEISDSSDSDLNHY